MEGQSSCDHNNDIFINIPLKTESKSFDRKRKSRKSNRHKTRIKKSEDEVQTKRQNPGYKVSL